MFVAVTDNFVQFIKQCAKAIFLNTFMDFLRVTICTMTGEI
jgi:hypothetical protein